MDVTAVLVVLVFAIPLRWLWCVYSHRKRIAAAIDPLGGDRWYPLVGTTRRLINLSRKDWFEAYCKRNRDCGVFFRSWVGTIPQIHLSKAELIEPVLTSNDNLTKGANYRFLIPWLGEGLVTAAGNKWRHHRKLITPTFHFKILDNMTEIFSEKGQMLAEQLALKADGQQFFDVYPSLTHCSLDIICETAMGVKINAMERSDSEYVKAVYGITDIMLYRTFHPVLHSDFIFNLTKKGALHRKYLSILHGFTRKVIQERKMKLLNNNNIIEESEGDILLGEKRRLAFLDLLLESSDKSHGLSDEEIREEVDTFMFAGHDTTTSTVCWTLLTIANNPDVQEKVHEELDSIFQGEDRHITPRDVNQMKYLDRVIKETLRLIPVIPAIARILEKDVEIGGRIIPAGVSAAIHLWELHRDPEYFPEPERFDPDRFLPENAAKRHPYAFVPFSAGPRNCIGQKFAQRNSKILLAHILRKFKIKAEKPIADMKYLFVIVLRPYDGLKLLLEPRN